MPILVPYQVSRPAKRLAAVFSTRFEKASISPKRGSFTGFCYTNPDGWSVSYHVAVLLGLTRVPSAAGKPSSFLETACASGPMWECRLTSGRCQQHSHPPEVHDLIMSGPKREKIKNSHVQYFAACLWPISSRCMVSVSLRACAAPGIDGGTSVAAHPLVGVNTLKYFLPH